PLLETGAKCAIFVVSPARLLNTGPKRLSKRDGIGDVPAVAGEPRSNTLAFRDRRPGKRTAGDAQAPRFVDIILGAGAVDLRVVGAVHIEQVVPFAEQSDLRLDHVENGAYIVTRSFDMEKRVFLA